MYLASYFPLFIILVHLATCNAGSDFSVFWSFNKSHYEGADNPVYDYFIPVNFIILFKSSFNYP